MDVVLVGEVPDFFTVEEAARILRLSRSTMYRLVRLYLGTNGREGIPVRMPNSTTGDISLKAPQQSPPRPR